MKPLYKHIIASFFALATIAYLVWGLWMSRHTMTVPVCKQCHVRILDERLRQYVSYNELIDLIKARGIYPVGKLQSHIALQPIEDAVRQHPMVRRADCYRTVGGDVAVALTQREPLLRVVTEAETYFVDTDRKQMPVRPSVKTPVLVVTGQVSHRMAMKEASDFAYWLQHDRYWRQYISRVSVVGPRHIHLHQINGRAEIILGDWQGYERKMKKLLRWYEADSTINQNQYQQVDLRFHNQVIGIKQDICQKK